MSNHEHQHGKKHGDHEGQREGHDWKKHGDHEGQREGHDWKKHGDNDGHREGHDGNKYAHNGDGCENPCHSQNDGPGETDGCDLQAALAHLTDAISVVEAAIGQLDHTGGGTDFAHFDGSDQGHHYDSFA